MQRHQASVSNYKRRAQLVGAVGVDGRVAALEPCLVDE